METASNNVFRVRHALSLTDVVDKRENCCRNERGTFVGTDARTDVRTYGKTN